MKSYNEKIFTFVYIYLPCMCCNEFDEISDNAMKTIGALCYSSMLRCGTAPHHRVGGVFTEKQL